MASGQDEALVRLGEVFAAQLRDRDGAARSGPTLRRIVATRDTCEDKASLLPRLIRREDTIASERQPPAATAAISVLQDERLGPARLHPKPETRQLIVPDKCVAAHPRMGCIHHSLCEPCHRVSTG